MAPEVLAERVVDHLHARGVRRVYVSNDIDGTDARHAAACGTPEPDGLLPDQVRGVIRAVGEEFSVIGADLVELAPGLSLDRGLAAESIKTAVGYVQETLSAIQTKGQE